MTSVLGVDGCKGGWVGALLHGTTVSWRFWPTAVGFLSEPVDVVAVDIPIGLPTRGVRTCDVLARRALPGQTSSVFPAPVRAVLAATTYAQARALSVAVDGRSLSAQAFGIVPKVAEVDAARGLVQGELLEVHPELSFSRLAGLGGLPVPLPRKKSAAGALARVRLLTSAFGELPLDPPPQASLDDCLDALACLWTGLRWLRGEAEVVGDELDPTGQVMRIVT